MPQTPIWAFQKCAVIVGYPGDEAIWAAGTILMHPESQWTVITLRHKSEQEFVHRFFEAVAALGAAGAIANLDDKPDLSKPINIEIQRAIMEVLPYDRYDLVITHGPWGEQKARPRQEETSKAVFALLENEVLFTGRTWRFAYEAAAGTLVPRFVRDADTIIRLTDSIWQKKYDIVTKIYGCAPNSFEAKAAGRVEAFWNFAKHKHPEKPAPQPSDAAKRP